MSGVYANVIATSLNSRDVKIPCPSIGNEISHHVIEVVASHSVVAIRAIVDGNRCIPRNQTIKASQVARQEGFFKVAHRFADAVIGPVIVPIVASIPIVTPVIKPDA